MSTQQLDLPLLPLRDVVVYPHMVLPLFVGREKSIKALQSAMDADKEILLVAQKVASEDEPRPGELYRVGTVASILQLLKLPDGTVKVLIEGGPASKCIKLLILMVIITEPTRTIVEVSSPQGASSRRTGCGS